MRNGFYYNFPIGKIGIVEDSGAIVRVFFCPEKKYVTLPDKGLSRVKNMDTEFNLAETVLIKKAALQLEEYFGRKRKKFELPLNLTGTEFQVSVWKALETIPFGETRSYGDIAARIGNEKACRAVGMANNRNPIIIIVPCHRVIGRDGSLTGYGGGLDVKKFLLELEGCNL